MNKQVKLRAFFGNPNLKASTIQQVRKHRFEGHITQDATWDESLQCGCAIGVTLEAYLPSRYPTHLGLPQWLARVEERIFEHLPKSTCVMFPEDFLESIAPGAETESLRFALASWLLSDQVSNLARLMGADGNLRSLVRQASSLQEKMFRQREVGQTWQNWVEEINEQTSEPHRPRLQAAAFAVLDQLSKMDTEEYRHRYLDEILFMMFKLKLVPPEKVRDKLLVLLRSQPGQVRRPVPQQNAPPRTHAA